MATCLQAAMAALAPSSFPFHPSRRRSLKARRGVIIASSSAKASTPPPNPKDPFLDWADSVSSPPKSDFRPFLDGYGLAPDMLLGGSAGSGQAATVALPHSSFPSNPSPNRSVKAHRSASNARSSAKIPKIPLNPNDPFLQWIASVASTSEGTEGFATRTENSDSPPYLEAYGSGLIRGSARGSASSSQMQARPYRSRRKETPPDLPSILLDERIVYIGMPLVPAVTELVISQLIYLQWDDPNKPIYLYIHSTGTTNDDGERVGMESEGFAIYDILTQVDNEINTVALGCAIGMSCLLLAAGTKGRRFMMPHAQLIIKQPRIPSIGLMPADNVDVRAKEVKWNRNNLIRLFAEHTGNSIETVTEAVDNGYYMTPYKALKFGVVDKVLWEGQEDIMKESVPPEFWSKTAGISKEDGFKA